MAATSIPKNISWLLVATLAAFVCGAGCGTMPEGGYVKPVMHEPFRLGHLEAETAYVLPAGDWVLGDVEYFRSFDNRKKYSTTGRLEIGVTNRLMLDADVSYVTVYWDDGRETDGLGDIRTGAKYLLFDNDALVWAVRAQAFYPNGRPIRDTGEGIFRAELGLAASAKLDRETWAVHAASGVRWREAAGPDSAYVTMATEYRTPLAPDEMNLQLGFKGYIGEGPTPVELTPGMHVKFNELPWRVPIEFEVSLGVPIGLTSDAPDWGFRLQLDAKF